MRDCAGKLLRGLSQAALLACLLLCVSAHAADKLIGLHSAQVMSQSMPWIAQEAGLFKKYDLDFRLVFIPSSPVATASLDEIAPMDPRAKFIKPQDLIDRRYLIELEKSGAFGK